ncbi:PIN domain-containing protein [Aggregatibacter actinomycetemcomitans]|uniref:type II toxin-antitoxin system VapC family toxin n=1 Tax=Aggregatibacter actinomycetemcomitans TaxID=714 RepID=UPI00197C9B57|nr:PIN domain-containing protein [Aggregatibacter actinomycetemcomitans]MBN6077287.1 PIN domain-containing protein [Aggregatibacter actinomycetemcomitans]
MVNKILLDANFLIKALEDKNSVEAHKLIEFLERDDTVMYITPLIYYEVLRGINWTHDTRYQEFKDKLSLISNLNIDKSIGLKAADLFRFEKYYRDEQGQTPKKPDKHNFDIMHFSTAKIYELEIASNDADVDAWENLYQLLEKNLK